MKSAISIAALATLLAGAGGAPAASITAVPEVLVGNNSSHEISVYFGKAAYSGVTNGVFGDGTVLDYRFYNNATLSSGGYANGGGGRISAISTGGGLTDYNMDYADVWTVSDPGLLSNGIPAFSSAADFGGSTKTMSGQQVVNGTIDAANLVTGTVYVLCGHYLNPFTVTLTMSGSGQTNIVQSVTVDPPSSRNKYILAFNFDDAGDDYDTIAYNYTGGAGNRSRFMGVILDAEPTPGFILWYGLTPTSLDTNAATVSALSTEAVGTCALVWDGSDQGTTNLLDWSASSALGPQSADTPIAGALSGLFADSVYIWRIYGTNGVGASWSAPQTLVTPISDLQAPVFTNAAILDDTLNVTLTWQDNTETETGFVLMRSSDEVNFTTIGSPAANATTYTDTVFSPGTYTYRLSATNRFTQSGTDATLCVTNITVPAPPLYLAAIIGLGTSFNISVYPGHATYTSTVTKASGVFGDGTVLDYRFFNNAGGFNTNGYANGSAGRIPPATSGTPYSANENFNWADLWTATDPGTDFASPPDYPTNTLPRATGISGTVDISGLLSGTLHFIYGGATGDDAKIVVTMSGPEQADIVVTHTEPNGSQNMWVFTFPFQDATDYETISYVYGSPPNASRGRFMGLILDGKAAPSGTILQLR